MELAPSARARRWALGGAIVNTVLSAVKILAGVFGHSYALIADGIESSLDIASSLVIWGGLRYAAKEPDRDHPYGHGKAEPISALIASTALTGAALLLAVLSVRELLAPDHAMPSAVGIVVVLVVIVVKEFMFRRVVAVSEETGSQAMRADAWHHRSDAITSVAALVGILVARIGGPGWERADARAALFACAVIGFNGYKLVVPALAEIMDTAPDPEIAQKVHQTAEAVPGVAAVEQCRVRKMGLEFYVDLHVGVEGTITVAAGHEIAHRVKDAVPLNPAWPTPSCTSNPSRHARIRAGHNPTNKHRKFVQCSRSLTV